jgi:hypothetical protein
MIAAKRTLAVFAMLFIGSPHAFAHHSFAEFDTDTSITLEGVVDEVWFNNPHVRYYLSVKNDDGSEDVWDIHGAAPNRLLREGWNKDSIKVGDKVKMIGNPMREGAPRLLLDSVVLPDGTTLPRG